MNFGAVQPLTEFDRTLAVHTTNVRQAFDRVFKETDNTSSNAIQEAGNVEVLGRVGTQPRDPDSAAAFAAAGALLPHLQAAGAMTVESLAQLFQGWARESRNPHRALTFVARVAASLDKATVPIALEESHLVSLVRLCGASEFFGEMLASNPALVNSLATDPTMSLRRDFRAALRSSIEPEQSFAAELSAFRREWSRLLLEIGVRDAAEVIPIAEANRLQTELAVASLNVAHLIARRELVRRYGRLAGSPPIAILGMGRLGTGGFDYGSDLDIIIVYDSLADAPIASLTREEAYSLLAELMIAALSSMTREGYLYRVDLRLRPNGKSGPLVTSSVGFLDYAKEGMAVWEWLAYVKLRAVAGDLELGRMIETHARHAVHQNAQQVPLEDLQQETRHVRDRLELEQGKRVRKGEIDIKYAAGGMLDVYFLVRYLQLRDDIPDEGDDRSTRSTLDRLEEGGSLAAEDYHALSEGYGLLREVDHQLRLLLGRSGRVPPTDHAVVRDIAKRLDFASAAELHQSLSRRMEAIREVYERLTH
jgi:glutamate-ammonia-ligase adenylyltransferase